MYVCLIISVKRLDRSIPNFAHGSTLAQRWFLWFMVYFVFRMGMGREGVGRESGGEGRWGQGRFIKLFFKPGRSRVIQASLCNNLKNISWSAIPSKDLFGIFQSDYSNSQRIFGKNRFSGDVLTCHVHCRPSLFRKHEHNIFDFISFNYLLHHV